MSWILTQIHSQREWVRGWGGGIWLLAGVNSPQIIHFLKEVEERTFRDPLFPNLSRRGHIRIMESLRLEIPPGSSSSTFGQIPPCSLNHIMNCHVYTFFEHLFSLRAAAKTIVFLFLEQIHQNPVSKQELTKWHSSAVLTSFKERSSCLNDCLVYKIFECRQGSHNCTKSSIYSPNFLRRQFTTGKLKFAP